MHLLPYRAYTYSPPSPTGTQDTCTVSPSSVKYKNKTSTNYAQKISARYAQKIVEMNKVWNEYMVAFSVEEYKIEGNEIITLQRNELTNYVNRILDRNNPPIKLSKGSLKAFNKTAKEIQDELTKKLKKLKEESEKNDRKLKKNIAELNQPAPLASAVKCKNDSSASVTIPKKEQIYHAFLQQISHNLAYRSLEIGQEIPTPFGKLIVNELFTNNAGLKAYGLIQEDDKGVKLEPILLIQGTKSLIQVNEDLTAESLGKDLFLESEEELKEWLTENSDCIVTGHSLGGAVAQHVAIKFRKHISSVITFNSPCIHGKDIKDFEQLIDKDIKDLEQLIDEHIKKFEQLVDEGIKEADIKELEQLIVKAIKELKQLEKKTDNIIHYNTSGDSITRPLKEGDGYIQGEIRTIIVKTKAFELRHSVRSLSRIHSIETTRIGNPLFSKRKLALLQKILNYIQRFIDNHFASKVKNERRRIKNVIDHYKKTRLDSLNNHPTNYTFPSK